MTSRDVHSFPTETLSEIFRYAVRGVAPAFFRRTQVGRRVIKTELERIANAPLLALSRVCSRWHKIAINTPTLWSRIEINGVVGDTPSVLETVISLVAARLERTREVPLSVSLICEDRQQFPVHVFQLLAQHSYRWEHAAILASLPGIDMSILKGRLPCLKTLTVYGSLGKRDFFGIAPRLEHLYVTPPMIHAQSFTEILEHKQLRLFGCVVSSAEEFGDTMSVLPKLPTGTYFYLETHLDSRTSRRQHPFKNPPASSITSSISTLLCEITDVLEPRQMSSILNHIFASLTLPRLQRLLLGCSVYPQRMLEFPPAQFLSLCERSDLGRSLRTLRIAEVRMTARDLLQILAVLDGLQHLEIGDGPERPKRKSRVQAHSDPDAVITDDFLRAMTCAPGQNCLVPHLSYFACVSRFVFTDSVLADFAASRVEQLANSWTSFHVRIHPFPETDDASRIPAVRKVLWELAARNKKLVYQVGREYETL
ncbi:hypothetical protein MSAN_01798300 [Mycena sanguinolenta]|uniref:F-box domain-containing protein n=1 Tax=Mycena sanguinolenta TaxID=230812 RepID=A0A8H6XRD0_9AGAR|nr:hypothetical protein MSAN_01798300 [Mycena sanguinolenta]